MQNEKEGVSGRTTPDLTLYWDSWDSVTKTQTLNSSIQHNENIMQNSSTIQSNCGTQDSVQQITSENRSPPSTPSISKGRGTQTNTTTLSSIKVTIFVKEIV